MSFVSGVFINRQAHVNVAVCGDDQKHRRFAALMDTGATMTAINEDLLAGMNCLPHTRYEKVETAGGVRDANSYLMHIGLWSGDTLSTMHRIEVIALPLGNDDILLGMDILMHCCFICKGNAFFLGFDCNDKKILKAAAAFINR